MKVYVIESVYGGESFNVERRGYSTYEAAVAVLDKHHKRAAGEEVMWYHDGQCDTVYYIITEVEICV